MWLIFLGLFIALCPGVLFTAPAFGKLRGKLAIAAIHAVIFVVVINLLNVREGFQFGTGAPNLGPMTNEVRLGQLPGIASSAGPILPLDDATQKLNAAIAKLQTDNAFLRKIEAEVSNTLNTSSNMRSQYTGTLLGLSSNRATMKEVDLRQAAARLSDMGGKYGNSKVALNSIMGRYASMLNSVESATTTTLIAYNNYLIAKANNDRLQQEAAARAAAAAAMRTRPAVGPPVPILPRLPTAPSVAPTASVNIPGGGFSQMQMAQATDLAAIAAAHAAAHAAASRGALAPAMPSMPRTSDISGASVGSASIVTQVLQAVGIRPSRSSSDIINDPSYRPPTVNTCGSGQYALMYNGRNDGTGSSNYMPLCTPCTIAYKPNPAIPVEHDATSAGNYLAFCRSTPGFRP